MTFCFTSGEGTALNAKAIFHRLQIQQVVNVEYHLGVPQTLGLTQEIRGPIPEDITHPTGITQSVVTQHGVPYTASQTLGIADAVVHAGAFGAGGTTPCVATFDSTVLEGQPLYVVSDTSVDLADNVTNFHVIGLAFEPVTSGNSGQYITEGTITLTDWSLIVGTTLLTPGAVYYLDSTTGLMTSTPTTTIGQHVVAVARAASASKLDIEIAEPILL